jgi:oligopeptide transport system substrate-binding protein
MLKRTLSLLLCLLMVFTTFVGCSSEEEELVNDGSYLYLYLGDQMYNFDPAAAYTNDSTLAVTSLMFDTLFTVGENGALKKSLVKSYEYNENESVGEYTLTLELKETYWSDGTLVSADDVVYAWKRILNCENNYACASLLYDIKNAKAAKEGAVSIDKIGAMAVNNTTVEIQFEEPTDYEAFLWNLTSVALAPQRENVVVSNDDWAKASSSIVTSGAYKIRTVVYDYQTVKADEQPDPAQLVLERNPYYYRAKDSEKAYDKVVKPFRIIVDYSLSDEDLMAAYENGEIFYVGEIPVSYRSQYAEAKNVRVSDALSTHAYLMNENAELNYTKDGKTATYKLLELAGVREALSLAIDRDAIADALVFAEAATALVPPAAMENYDAKALYRANAKDLLATSADVAAAKSKLSAAGIDASKYTFSITVRESDDAHMLIAEMVQAAWKALGFNVNLDVTGVIVNDDINTATEEVAKDIRDDIFNEKLYGINGNTFEVIAVDSFATNGGAVSMLAPYAKQFAGQPMDMTTLDYVITPHMTGYDSEEYNAIMEEYHATKDLAQKTALLQKAEELLMKDLPVIPVIYNQNAIMVSDDLSNVNPNFYVPAYFKKAKQKNYELYTETTIG